MSDYSGKVHRDIDGDSITLDPGAKIIFGNVTFTINAAGKLVVSGLPTSNPGAGQLWANSNVLTVGT